MFLMFLFGCFIPYQAILLPMARTLGLLGISNSISGLGIGSHGIRLKLHDFIFS